MINVTHLPTSGGYVDEEIATLHDMVDEILDLDGPDAVTGLARAHLIAAQESLWHAAALVGGAAMKPPVPFSGGKQRVAARIVDLFPPHDSYVEPFAGALSVMLAKPPSRMETANDIHGTLITFWRVLRDRPDDLERVCALTPHSRLEYRRSLEPCDDELEQARRVWVQLSQARGSRLDHKSGWRFVYGTNGKPLSAYLDGYISRIAPVADRLKMVSLENRDALEVIDAYGAHPGTRLYVAPPYLGETRDGPQYAHEFINESDHKALLELLTASPAAVALSGYDADLYRRQLSDWERHEFASQTMTGAPRVEVVWTNYTPAPTLFSHEDTA